MNLPKLSIQNYQFTLVIVILLIVLGITSIFQMPKSEDPQVSKAGASIIVIYPGATPADMEQLIVDPIENTINELDDIKKLESYCNDGLANISIEFISGCDPDDKFSDVNEKVNGIRSQLPDGIFLLETYKWSISDTNILQLALVSSDAPYRDLDKQAERLEKILKKVNGIKRAETWAFPAQEIRVSIDLERMSQLKIPLNRVIGAIQSSNINIPGGTIDAGIKRFSIQTSGSYQSVQQIKNTVVHSEGTKVIYLKDIADVTRTYEDNNYFGRHNGTRAVFVTLQQKDNTNIFQIMNSVNQHLNEFKKKLPTNISLQVVYDQSNSVDERISSFFSNMLQGIILVGIVILLGISLRGSLIVMLAIPTSSLIGITLIHLSGYGLQQMSITGLIIALGLLVDNAIVVIENISRFIQLGESRINAAINATSQIAWAIFAATITTLLSFLPIVMMRDISGEFIRSMPLTVIYTLTASLFIALTFTPFLASRILHKTGKQKEKKFQKMTNHFLIHHYRPWLQSALKHPAKILSLTLLLFFSSLMLFPLIGVSFFPKAEKKIFYVNINLPEGSNIQETNLAVQFVEKHLASKNEVQSYTANIGRHNPRLYYNMIEKRQQSHIGQVFIQLKNSVKREQMEKLLQELRLAYQNYPGAHIEIKELEQGPPVNAPIEIKIRGEKLEVLQKIASDIEHMFHETPGLINVNNPLSTSKTDIRININRDKAAMYGIPLADINSTIRMSIAGLNVSQYRDKDGKEYNIVVRSNFENQPRLNIFDKIYLSTANGSLIPLNQVATIELKLSSNHITHFNMDRSVTLTADVLSGYPVNPLTKKVLKNLDEYRWPIGYDYFVGGEMESQEESFGGMGNAVIIAVIAIFAVLVLQFRSFTQPLIIYAAIPLATIGSILALLFTGNTFSFTAFIGITSLAGIVVNNSIILVDYTNQLRQQGKELIEALIEAGETRFMPIFLTTMTTVGGLLPLAIQGGTLWAPMAWTIIGGLLTSTALTLIIVPVLYKLFSNHHHTKTPAAP